MDRLGRLAERVEEDEYYDGRWRSLCSLRRRRDGGLKEKS